MWNEDALPLIRASTCRDRFKMMLRLITFDHENTPTERKRKQIKLYQFKTSGQCL